MRMVEGNSKEYMWNITEDPTENPEEFLHGLIHATFQDGNGYVEGLTKPVLDTEIERILDYITKEFPGKVEEMKVEFDEVSELLKNTLFSPDWLKLGASDVLELARITAAFKSIKDAVVSIEKHHKQHETIDEPSSPSEESSPEIEMNDIGSPEPDSQMDPESELDVEVDDLTASQEIAQLDIKHVEDAAEGTHSNILKLAATADKFHTPNTLRELELAQKFLNNLNKQCLEYEEALMQDLLQLDGIDNPKVRGERKKAVGHIQQLLDDVNQVKDKVRALRESVGSRTEEQKAIEEAKEKKKKEQEEKLKQEEEERRRQEAEQKRANQETPEEALDEELDEEDSEQESQDQELEAKKSKLQVVPANMWRKMKFEPEFKIDRERSRFVLRSYIPGMDMKDVKLSVKGNLLVVQGYREPSPKELAVLKRQLWEQKKIPGYSKYFPADEDENLHLLRMGAGRYGSFSASFELPLQEVYVDKIQASYQGGVLQIVVPKRQLPPPRQQPMWADDFFGGRRGPGLGFF
eukprot:TRINITY_DN3295_c0_g1_i4.p1 TRINITY_DN3295_c0_g1~~TRINITY_DN3295_c0_g1_i4.p1  ORF type:complete len:522 (-),score=142.44 TRINITY_DN3295_c0_g1_i4:144-1709(-)